MKDITKAMRYIDDLLEILEELTPSERDRIGMFIPTINEDIEGAQQLRDEYFKRNPKQT